MFRTSSVHHQERFVQAVFADLVCGNTRTTRHVQPLRSCRKNFLICKGWRTAYQLLKVVRQMTSAPLFTVIQ